MKRSEMVAQICDNVLMSFFSTMDLQSRKLIADCMLCEVEKYGMLPPKYIAMEGKSSFPPDGIECTIIDWEPENE